ncbi:MAG: amino acid ABC transporter permease, partial [Enterococcus sp.]
MANLFQTYSADFFNGFKYTLYASLLALVFSLII